MRWTFSSVSLTKSGLKNHCSPGSNQFKGVLHRRPYRASNGAILIPLVNYYYKKILPMADNHPTFVETPRRRLVAYLPVFDLPFLFVHSFEDDRPNYGAI
jgi:hypothetical protein